jgi:hypothetical protein
MPSELNFDPDEKVSFEGRDITLREAVERYREAKALPDELAGFTAFRDAIKEPPSFSVEDFEELAGRPEFPTGSELRQGSPSQPPLDPATEAVLEDKDSWAPPPIVPDDEA